MKTYFVIRLRSGIYYNYKAYKSFKTANAAAVKAEDKKGFELYIEECDVGTYQCVAVHELKRKEDPENVES